MPHRAGHFSITLEGKDEHTVLIHLLGSVRNHCGSGHGESILLHDLFSRMLAEIFSRVQRPHDIKFINEVEIVARFALGLTNFLAVIAFSA